MAEIILHHYDRSPFAEKVRSVLGLKGAAWRSVQIPRWMPKPDLIPLQATKCSACTSEVAPAHPAE